MYKKYVQKIFNKEKSFTSDTAKRNKSEFHKPAYSLSSARLASVTRDLKRETVYTL